MTQPLFINYRQSIVIKGENGQQPFQSACVGLHSEHISKHKHRPLKFEQRRSNREQQNTNCSLFKIGTSQQHTGGEHDARGRASNLEMGWQKDRKLRAAFVSGAWP